MSTFHWRETLKAIKPPFFARLGCAFFVTVLAMGFFALVTVYLVQVSSSAYFQKDFEMSKTIDRYVSLIMEVSPVAVVVLAVIAFFESVDFLVWLKLPLYPPKPTPPLDPLEAFKPQKE